MTCDKHHLMWIRDRLIYVYNESPHVDYIHKLDDIIDRTTVCTAKNACELYDEYTVRGRKQ